MTTDLTALRAAAEAAAAALAAAEASASDTPAGHGVTVNNAHDPDRVYEAPKQETVEDAIAEARRRSGGRPAAAARATADAADGAAITAQDGRAEAARRAVRRS